MENNNNNNSVGDFTEEDEFAIGKFIEYCQIKSVHPEPDYSSIVDFLREYTKLLKPDEFKVVYTPEENIPIVIIKVYGKDRSLPAIVLNSHSDVVPVETDKWNYDPFAATRTENGNIYARGTQDMKCVTIQHIQALINLKKNKELERDVVITVVPHEETGGAGMKHFITTEDFKNLNIGVVLDEGLANENENEITIFYGERAPYWVTVTATGPVGHGSRFINNPASHKLIKSINKFLAYRDEQEALLNSQSNQCGKELGDVLTINLTMLMGGVAYNVVPSKMECGFDIRVPPTVEIEDFKELLNTFTEEEGVSYSFKNYTKMHSITNIDDNRWYDTVCESLNKFDLISSPKIFPAATDSRFIRQLGIPALGISPMMNTPILLHDHNEFLNDKIFIKGIEIFEDIIFNLANL